MGISTAIVLLVLGVVGAAKLIIDKKPDAKELIEKIKPYQGWVGFVAIFWGLWAVIYWIINVAGSIGGVPVLALTWLLSGLLTIALGLLFGMEVFKTFIKKEDVTKKMDEMAEKLRPFQTYLGMAGIVLGLWLLIANIFRIAI